MTIGDYPTEQKRLAETQSGGNQVVWFVGNGVDCLVLGKSFCQYELSDRGIGIYTVF